MQIHKVLLLPTGEIAEAVRLRTDSFEKETVEDFDSVFTKGDNFDCELPMEGFSASLHWESPAKGSALATISIHDRIVLHFAIASGLNENDVEIFRTFVAWIVSGDLTEYDDSTGYRPFEGLFKAKERPMLASVFWGDLASEEFSQVKGLDLFLAHSYLRSLGIR